MPHTPAILGLPSSGLTIKKSPGSAKRAAIAGAAPRGDSHPGQQTYRLNGYRIPQREIAARSVPDSDQKRKTAELSYRTLKVKTVGPKVRAYSPGSRGAADESLNDEFPNFEIFTGTPGLGV